MSNLTHIDKAIFDTDIQERLRKNSKWSNFEIAERVYLSLEKIGL